MKITCRLNGKEVLFNTFADKPVSELLYEHSEVTSIIPGCRKGTCGNCIILLDNEPVLSCLIPAFRIRDREITTFEGYAKTRFYLDVTRGYEEAGIQPCSYCYHAKSLLIESIIQENISPEPEEIINVLSVNRCSCVDEKDLVKIVETAAKYRRRRRVRRS
jgi:aerobic-type carbon monoxide dehydrogenase small subunit (CoxS/CutS family)